MASPYDIKSLQMVLGTFQFYARFIQDYATLTKPLTQLLRKEIAWNWGETQQQAFEQLKQAFTDPLLLVPPNYDKQFYVFTDASDFAIGGFISMDPAGRSEIVGYFSRTLTNTEINWSTYEKEALAVLATCEKYFYILQGRKFTLYTDNQ